MGIRGLIQEEVMKKTFVVVMAAVMLFVFSGLSKAAEPSIAGVWSMPAVKGKDKGKERFHVEIFEKDGIYYGKIIKLSILPANTICKKCRKDRQDKPLMDMLILSNLKREAGRYVEGKIYDVEEGNEYKCSMTLMSPDRLKVTACVMFICESHYWTKVK